MKDSTIGAGPAETVHAHHLPEIHGDAPAKPGQKICCVCGKDVAHEERFKDKKGRYWCYDCGVADEHRRHRNDTVQCPDCHNSLPENEMVEYEGHHLCSGCATRRTQSAKRQAARRAAAIEAEHHAQRQWRLMIAGSILFAVLAIALVIWRLV
ncbi:MAG TPA: hypothetical protein VG722_07185 [Tepidisphaeraceae bacterium]|nr:hypothetical protein [Tepidisphaeraceae bacterium]